MVVWYLSPLPCRTPVSVSQARCRSSLATDSETEEKKSSWVLATGMSPSITEAAFRPPPGLGKTSDRQYSHLRGRH